MPEYADLPTALKFYCYTYVKKMYFARDISICFLQKLLIETPISPFRYPFIQVFCFFFVWIYIIGLHCAQKKMTPATN